MNEVICTTASESVRNEGTADLLLIKGGSQNVEIIDIKTSSQFGEVIGNFLL